VVGTACTRSVHTPNSQKKKICVEWGWDGSTIPSLAIGNPWLLEKELVAFKGVASGRWSMLQWVTTQNRVCNIEQTGLDVLIFKKRTKVWGR